MTATVDTAVLQRITRRAFVQMVAMIHIANHRDDAQHTDPKVGGHPAACASAIDFMAALHLHVRRPDDFFCAKPHASPVDHSLHNLIGLFRHPDGKWFDSEEGEAVMHRLRSFPHDGAPVFQSYHASTDPDNWRVLPSGSVGIPPVNGAYIALAYRYARLHGWDIEEPHVYCMMGDSEFREGSLAEVMPEVAERELGNVTWIVDYNRQNLDGTRTPNKRGLGRSDADRMQGMFEANGWHVIQLRHGAFREEILARKDGDKLRRILEREFSDYHFQTLLWKNDAKMMRDAIRQENKDAGALLDSLSDEDVLRFWGDLGGHDPDMCIDAFEQCRKDPTHPTLVIAHTIKGRGLECVAANGNHSALPDEKEVVQLLESEGLSLERPFERFADDTEEGRFLAERQKSMREGIEALDQQAAANRKKVADAIQTEGGIPDSLDINLKLAPTTHTQWMWGQVAAKLIRIGTYDELTGAGRAAGKEPTKEERRWSTVADLMMTMAPDVGTSTNINPAMDEKIFGPESEDNYELQLELRERLRPQLAPTDKEWSRHIRFEIAEANCMSASGSFGKMGDLAGIPFLPMMTIYDFFIKRALDQLYYNLYWQSGFILVGTPSGITLAPEGAQHSWKSDIQIPNLITWEPAFAQELDWIFCDAVQRHYSGDNQGRSGVLIRAVTRGLEQKPLLENLRRQKRFKAELPAGAELAHDGTEGGLPEREVPALDDQQILATLRDHVLAGGYMLVDHRGYAGYRPGENVVHLFTMGALVPEVLQASQQLLQKGIYANVIAVTSPDLLMGELGRKDGYQHLTQTLGINGDLHLQPADDGAIDLPDSIDLAGRRVPVVSVHDGELGLLDNIGSVLGVRQVPLGVRKFSKSGTPKHVYEFHGMHAEGIVEACGEALALTAQERVRLTPGALKHLQGRNGDAPQQWRELWPEQES